jgi:integrase
VEATALIAAVPPCDRALWATAFYSGLRLGELRALRWEDVDLAAGVIRVERSWDRQAGPVKPKSAKGTRSVPIASALRDFLVEHKMATRRSSGLVFGRSEDQAFDPSTVNDRAYASWKKAKLAKITMHEARHTYASLMIAAGVNAKALSEYMGHSGISITLDRYGHLMPGSEAEAAGLLDAYLERAGTAARIATIAA